MTMNMTGPLSSKYNSSCDPRMKTKRFLIMWVIIVLTLLHLDPCFARSIETIVEAKQPYLIYGTAWKKKKTTQYVSQAIRAGFRFFDTACQPKHYREDLVGLGWTSAAHELGLKREDFYLQTKFTSMDGQDPNRVPYDPKSPLEEQIKSSLQVSLQNLQTDYLDALILHGPEETINDTMRAWRILESFVEEGIVKRIGISNVYDHEEFLDFYELAKIKPQIVQNHLDPDEDMDIEMREFCESHGIWYQSFWTLTANEDNLENPRVQEIALSKGLTPETLMFAFLMSTGYAYPISGTTSQSHMLQDIAVMERMQGGEVFFRSEKERADVGKLLGFPEFDDN